MFQAKTVTSTAESVTTTLELILHNVVHKTRSSHRDAVFAIIVTILQNVFMILVFFLFMQFMGMRGAAVRGDFLLYVMSGVFLYITFVGAIGAVASADGPTSSTMQHLPMNTFIAIWSSALSLLYRQVVSVMVILLLYHLLYNPIEIYRPIAAFAMILLTWFSGCAFGMVFLALSPWAPRPVAMARMAFQRINMFASGKMFLANTLPVKMTAVFAWNPLFHIIDQSRGFVFINYNPLKTSLTYPIVVSLVLIMLGMILESMVRKHASASWAKP